MRHELVMGDGAATFRGDRVGPADPSRGRRRSRVPSRRLWSATTAALVLAGVLAGCAPDAPVPAPCLDGWQQVYKTSTTPSGGVHEGGGGAIAADGRFVAVGSAPGRDAAGVYDLITGAWSTAPGATYLDGHPVISADGSIVVFQRYTLPTNGLYPPVDVVRWDRTAGTVTTISSFAQGYSRVVAITPDGSKVLIRHDNPGASGLAQNYTTVWDAASGTGTDLDLSVVLPGGATSARAMSDDGDQIALDVFTDIDHTTGIYRRSTNTFTPSPGGRAVLAFDGDGQIVLLGGSSAQPAGGRWNRGTGVVTNFATGDLPVAIDRAGTSVVVAATTGAPGGPFPINSIDLGSGTRRVVSSAGWLDVSGTVTHDRLLVDERPSIDTADVVVKQRC